MRRVSIVSQVIPQWYVDILTDAIGNETQIEIMTGSRIDACHLIFCLASLRDCCVIVGSISP